MQITAVKNAIADAVRSAVILPAGVGKLTCSGFVPDSVVVPCFFAAEVDVNYDLTHGRGTDELLITCRVLAGRADDRSSQRILDGMLSGSGPASLKAAFTAARGGPGEMALGGVADDVHLQRVQGYRWYEHAGSSYVGAELAVRVIGDGRT